uniref:Ataxin-10 domain-containing protein n=1 Tax=Kalanchoe fedtschenkoi TaxID=63787 RepID=A0A7N0RG50_KALFE
MDQSLWHPLFIAANSHDKTDCLEILIKFSQTMDGRAHLASQNILFPVLKLLESVSYPQDRDLLVSSLKLLRNLCAGNIYNQNLFVELKGVSAILSLLTSVRSSAVLDDGVVRIGLQLLGNVSLAGEEHQRAVWQQLFPTEFAWIAKIQRCNTCDPLCMIIYLCSDGSSEMAVQLFEDQGLSLIAEIIRTTSRVGFVEDWFKLLISRTCLEETHFTLLFSKLYPVAAPEDHIASQFSDEQSFLLQIVGDILNERLKEIIAPTKFSSTVIDIFRKAVASVDFASRSSSGLPTGSPLIDVLGYSLTLIRDLCAQGDSKDASAEFVDSIISSGLLELLLDLLRQLEPPAIVKKGMDQAGSSSPFPSKLCPYKGFRRDIVGVIGNCAFHRKHVQDYIRKKNGIILLLQQCVTDEENPYLREWGIWSIRNLLEDNLENQKEVADLKIQGAVDVPEISGLGIKLEVDKQTGHARLVNIPT